MEYTNVGAFKLKIYYLKSAKSTVEIIRDFQVRVRKKMLNDFSGIKIYRDDFKVRPYGDDGAFYDWIDLSKRVQSSPAAASHEKGNWRVSPNQLIGSVSISRITNPKLEDTANREGMSINSEYNAFVKLLEGIIAKFEYDRQYPLREYAAWKNEKEKAHEDRRQKIYEQVMKEQADKEEREKLKKNDDSSEADTKDKQEKKGEDYTKDDLKDVIYSIGKKKDYEMTVNQLLMVLSSAGVMAQTFAHEISRIATNLGSRGQHLKESINLLLDYKPYIGDEDFNPYDMLEELSSTDILLSEWVNLIMDCVNKENFHTQEVFINEFLVHIVEKWSTLLARKHIRIEDINCSEDIKLSLPIVDLHLLLNNFLLNSAYFLEECEGERIIKFKVYKEGQKIYLDMENNGPELAKENLQNPDIVLDATVSSKFGGTGLGLWVARESVERNDGRLQVIPISSGFMLRAYWKS
ncbi:ATP-binding protein [Anaerosporobacter mobilis]|uniref:ATP-binding protein n=1 Tax=Anaerosporobacter mobilis TaxID=264463 RepID=UPI0011148802|nr:ATP-binding protein [Anaerosporobacter mobilis]